MRDLKNRRLSIPLKPSKPVVEHLIETAALVAVGILLGVLLATGVQPL